LTLVNRSIAVIAVLGVLGVGTLGYVNRRFADALVEARAEVQDARQETKTANAEAGRALVRAAEAETKAAAAADSGQYKPAYEHEKEAVAHLKPALESCIKASRTLDDKSGKLLNASHDSFWKHLTPKLGVGGAVGVNPAGRPDAVIGITLSWSL
jgi:hypothetical protein